MRRSDVLRMLLAFALLGVSGAPAARADLLDEEEPGVGPKPAQPPPPAPGKPAPAPAPAPSPGKPAPQTGPAAPAPAPHPTGPGTSPASTPSPGAQVIAPKPATKTPKPGKKENEPVHFESKGLKGLREKGMVELVDDVVVTQADLRMEAKHAQVFFDEAAKDVLKVIAEGDVKIYNVDPNTGEKMKAFGDRVIFLNKDRTVILDGNARLWRGEDSVIRGKKITYEMDSGWIKADRVAGELAPTEQDKADAQKKKDKK